MRTFSLPNLTSSGRAKMWALLCLAWLAALAVAPVPLVSARDEKKAAEVPAAADDSEVPAESKPAEKKSMLTWAIEASGPIGVFLVALSVYFTALVIRLFLEYRVKEAVPAALIEKLETAIKEKKFQEAYDACRDDNSFLARLVRTGVANLPNGRNEAKEAMNAMAEEIVVTMEGRISYLATIGTLGPMIGLVGTVWGMILSFQEIATASGGQARPERLAAGISTALFITLEGISLSVPAIFFFAFFRNRIAQISMEATKVAYRTISAFWTAAKQQPAARASV